MTAPHTQPVFSFGAAMSLLMRRAGVTLTNEEVAWLASGLASVDEVATRAAVVAEGIACLVAVDGRGGSAPQGNFREPADASDLAMHFADTLSFVAGLHALRRHTRELADRRAAAAAAVDRVHASACDRGP